MDLTDKPELTRDTRENHTQTSTTPTIDQVTKIIATINDVLNGKKITQGLVIRVIANCMTVSAKMKIPGSIKKKVVTDALEQYIRTNSDLSQDEIELLLSAPKFIV